MSSVVIQPRVLMTGPLTLSPMMERRLVMIMMSSMSGGVEKPCTIPAKTSARMGLMPRKLMAMATSVNRVMAA